MQQSDIVTWIVAMIAALLGAAATLLAPVIQKRVTDQTKKKRSKKQELRYRAEHASQYCQRLRENPQFINLQMTGMGQGLEIEKIYIDSRVYVDHMLSYEIEEELRNAEETQKPEEHLKAIRQSQERRAQEGLDPARALLQYRHSVVVGDPGSGKTTMLKHLTIQAASGALPDLPAIPIYIEMSKFTIGKYSNLIALATQQWQQYDNIPEEELRPYLEQAMQEGKILLLLDGLDETAMGENKERAEQAYIHACQLIEDLATRYPQLPILVAVRKATYRNQCWPRLQGFDDLEIAEFTPEATRQFVRNWFIARQVPEKDHLIDELHMLLSRNPRLEELASNPLLLSLIVLLYQQDLELPEQRVDLYRRCVDMLLQHWDSQRNVKRLREFDFRKKYKLLKEIAWHFHEQGLRYFPKMELLQVIAQVLPTIGLESERSQDILDEIVRAHGLIKEQAQELYGFSHMTFQEYFVALYINDCSPGIDCPPFEILLSRIDKPWWEEVLTLYAGITQDASPLLRELLARSQQLDFHEQLFHTNLLRAGHCLEVDPIVKDIQLREELLDNIFNIMQTTLYSMLHKEISCILVRINRKAINLRLLQLLSLPLHIHSDASQSLSVAKSVAGALGNLGDRRLAEELLILLDKKEVSVRAHIALAVGKLGRYNPHVREKLLALLKDENEDWYVKLRVADALGELRDHTLAPQLMRQLKLRGRSDSMYYRLAITLGKLGNPAIIPDLLELLEDDNFDNYVRGGIVIALRMMANQEIATRFIRLLRNEQIEVYVREQIVMALGEMERQLIPTSELVAILDDPGIAAEVRGKVAILLCSSASPGVLNVLLGILADINTDRKLQTSVAEALACLADPEARTFLESLLKQPQLEVNLRGNVLVALAAIGENGVLSEMLDLLADSSTICTDVQINIIKALGQLGQRHLFLEQNIIKHLLEVLKEQHLDVYVGRVITETLSMLNISYVIPDLLDLLDQKLNSHIRQGIAKTLALWGQGKQTQERLLAILKNMEPPDSLIDDVYETLWRTSQRY